MKRFSSGMHARLGFAIAAHLDPDILIADEVLAVGDAQFQEKCLKKMDALGQTGRTIIFVSHDINAVLTLCNRGAMLDQGKLAFCGDIALCASAYIKQWEEQGSSWEGCLGDETVRVYSASIIFSEEKREFFYQGEKALVCFEYEVFSSTPELYFSLEIRSKDYRLLGRSQTSDDAEQFAIFAEKGRHKAYFEIDTALFHEGEYLVSLQCTIHNYKPLIIDDIILKLSVYASRREAHTTTLPQRRAGLFLGHNWSKLPSSPLLGVISHG
jgi:lipopolysaccharide transport system ATP-binding protein